MQSLNAHFGFNSCPASWISSVSPLFSTGCLLNAIYIIQEPSAKFQGARTSTYDETQIMSTATSQGTLASWCMEFSVPFALNNAAATGRQCLGQAFCSWWARMTPQLNTHHETPTMSTETQQQSCRLVSLGEVVRQLTSYMHTKCRLLSPCVHTYLIGSPWNRGIQQCGTSAKMFCLAGSV